MPGGVRTVTHPAEPSRAGELADEIEALKPDVFWEGGLYSKRRYILSEDHYRRVLTAIRSTNERSTE
jgi:hypothetical protein